MPDLTDLDDEIEVQRVSAVTLGADPGPHMRCIQRLARIVRVIFGRQQQLEDRVAALEQRFPPP
jgi:hypothetical protein